jgi:hypothetical protein
MKIKIYYGMLMAGIVLLNSCGNTKEKSLAENHSALNRIKQQEDGTISLILDKADSYSDLANPANNTAEWDVVVSKSGRYNVWLSSATRDTNDLKYKKSVLVSVQDARIEGRPACDKIILNSKDVTYPYFRADSFMGSMYIQDTGEYHIQIMSEQILPKNYNLEASEAELSKLLSVSFTPEKR